MKDKNVYVEFCLFCWSKDDSFWEFAMIFSNIDHIRIHHRIFMNLIKTLLIPEHIKKDLHQFVYSNQGNMYECISECTSEVSCQDGAAVDQRVEMLQ